MELHRLDQPLTNRQPGTDLALLPSRMNCSPSSLTPARRLRFWQPLLLISGDWLIASCGLRLDDEAVRVAVALRLGLGICVPHSCSCGENVDAWGQHAFVCKHASGRTQRHHALNDVVERSFASAGIPVSTVVKRHGCNHVGRLLRSSLFRHCSYCS